MHVADCVCANAELFGSIRLLFAIIKRPYVRKLTGSEMRIIDTLIDTSINISRMSRTLFPFFFFLVDIGRKEAIESRRDCPDDEK